jgi:mannose-1-phosphate guanylyltransferase
MVRETVERILPLVPSERVRILTGDALGGMILDTVPALGAGNLLAEPVARGTAPVLAWAAFEIRRRDPDAVMFSLHADHAIAPASQFRALLRVAGAAAAKHRRLITIGAAPDRAETGYGYVLPGSEVEPESGVFEVARFTEKPTRSEAEALLRDGYLWNTGIFTLGVSTFLEEIERHTPEIAGLLPLLERGDVRGFFERAPVLSVDHGVLERSDRVAVVKATFSWDDVGGWNAVARTRQADAGGNVIAGDATLVESTGCIVWSEDDHVVTFGTHDLVIVRANGITFITPRDRAPDLKALLERLPPALREPGGEP